MIHISPEREEERTTSKPVVAARLFKYFNRFACFFQSYHEFVCFSRFQSRIPMLSVNKIEQYHRVLC